jgi:hypothetical protein
VLNGPTEVPGGVRIVQARDPLGRAVRNGKRAEVGDTGPLGAASPAVSWPILAMMDYLRLLRTM